MYILFCYFISSTVAKQSLNQFKFGHNIVIRYDMRRTKYVHYSYSERDRSATSMLSLSDYNVPGPDN